MKKILFLSILASYSLAFSQQYIDLQRTLFGIEYSFQDQEMVNEPGRMTMTTPHKEEKLKQMLNNYVKIRNLPESTIEYKSTWKPGYFLNVPQDGRYVINTEPVTIEFNTTPKKLNEILPAAKPIYQAAAMANLKPYINPAAERSGMGHIHVGGWKLQDSPFYQHENLLRNVLTFYQKHPSLLYGFAEAYDMGKNSNIETLHSDDQQQALKGIVTEYDSWIKQKLSERSNGLLGFINFVKQSTAPVRWTSSSYGFFAHYRFINLEHVQSLGLESSPESEGKYTIEFRMFRPPPSAAHAEAMAKLLVAVMDYLAKPDYLEEFKIIPQSEFNNFMTGSKVESDWQEVKKLLKLENKYLDSMVTEFVSNIHSKVVAADQKAGLEVFESYSEKELKGTVFEVRFEVSKASERPMYEIEGQLVNFEKVKIGRRQYWIGTVRPLNNNLQLDLFKAFPMSYVKKITVMKCPWLFAS